MKFKHASYIALILLLAGCPEDKKHQTGLIFSHEEHAEEIEDVAGYKDCRSCHKLTDDKAHYGLPAHVGEVGCNGAGKCHPDAVDLAQITPKEACLQCHTRESGEMNVVSKRFTDVIFSHAKHEDPAGFKADCVACHSTVDKDQYHKITKTMNTHAMSMETCMDCHQEQGASNTCETCHQSLHPELKPDYHTAAWNTTHGKVLRRYGGTEICARCHDSLGQSGDGAHPGGDSCNECHQQSKPASHSFRWAKSLHGRAANRDRRSCATCHQADFCSDCHAQQPASHFTPQFIYDGSGHKDLARKKMRSCYTCHSFEADCSECHSR